MYDKRMNQKNYESKKNQLINFLYEQNKFN